MAPANHRVLREELSGVDDLNTKTALLAILDEKHMLLPLEGQRFGLGTGEGD